MKTCENSAVPIQKLLSDFTNWPDQALSLHGLKKRGSYGNIQPQVVMVGLLSEMIAKFEEDPPLSSKTTGDNKDPHELLAFVSNLQINDGGIRHHNQPINKVSVIGGGDLGMASVMSILSKCKVDKLVFIDVAESSTKGGSTDLEIFSLPKVEVSRDFSASAGSRVVVVTANAWSSEQSYVSVVQTNVDLYRGIIPNLARLSPNTVMIIASQPVDIMTHVAWRQSGLPPTHVIGAGCNLDSERLSHILDINLNTHKQAWVIGELSDNKVAVMSNTGLSSSAQPQIAPGSNTTKPLLDRAFEIMKNRGQRSWSVGLSIADITNSILTNKMKTHSVSTLAQGWGGIGTEVFLSLPCIMGSNGSTRLAGVSLGQEEDSKLRDSVTSLSNLMRGILQKSGLDWTKGTPTGGCPEGLEWPGGEPVYNSGAGKAEWSLGPREKGLE
ncbi:ubiquitin-conjugating enzyme E2 variant 3-like protein [Lates japonicus]|uniref:Ubiquitin-conjugating enzyme E2 variant 3-like protein n=1 Tax=Lates japonicus TaxID=270547 RepID=A0AAD3MAU4_LATJO|nr:ubiquitin-conjugating enzyme E2 variant 3-like protein [Lates japonicus]